ncbi:DUF2199 domain-containing protein [Streptomyces sp. NPDC057677]|uniref:DUF2199 domain-containing protein n=1 Tax=unclassified Streptomyces TaxID=2593676 RepID=UPI0036B6E9FE
MTRDLGFTCSCCGAHHPELPMNYSTTAPYVWDESFSDRSDSLLSSDQCVIQAQHYFVKGLIEIPVIDSDDVFSWAVWVSLSRDNFARAADKWNTPGREAEAPYFGWLSTELSLYSPSTINLKTHVHTRPVGHRPRIELEPTEHSLAVEQRTGITLARVRQIAETVLHATADNA